MRPSLQLVPDPQIAPSPQSFHRILASVVAIFALAGAVIHVEAVFDHRDLAVVAAGFVVMAVAQTVVAVVVMIRPVLPVIVAAGALHAAILLTWIVSRTLGLPLIPGAETVAPVGVADVVANTFSIAVVATAIVAVVSNRSGDTAPLSARTTFAMRVVSLAGAVLLTVAALSVPHEHSHADGEDPAHVAEHTHDHEP